MSIETILTQTPLSAMINTIGLNIQSTLSSIITGTPVFKAAAVACLCFFMLKHIFFSQHSGHQTHLFIRVMWHVLLLAVSFSVLNQGKSNITFNSVDNKPWSSYSQVASNQKFSNLSNSTSGMTLYAWIYSSLQELSVTLTQTISDALGSSLYAKDPSFIYRTLGQTAVEGLKDPATAADLNALLRDCADTATGFVFSNTSTLKDVFDLTKPGCQTEWNTFQSDIDTLTSSYVQQYSPDQYNLISGVLPGVNPLTLAHLSVSNAVIAHIKSEAIMANARHSDRDEGNSSSSDATMNMNYTYSQNTDDQIALEAQHPARNALLGLTNWLGWNREKDSFELFNKAEVASAFNQISYLIPAATAIIQMILCVGFVFIVLIAGCGFIRPFFSWLYSMVLVALYNPISVFIYKIPILFMNQSALAQNSSNLASDPLMLAGAKLIDSQITQIQTICIALQIMAFFTCVIGAIKGHQYFRATTGGWGMGMLALGASAAHTYENISSMASESSSSESQISGQKTSQTNMNGQINQPSNNSYGKVDSAHQSDGFHTGPSSGFFERTNGPKYTTESRT